MKQAGILRGIFRASYLLGSLAVVIFFFFLEWESLKGHFLSKVLNPLVHLGVILALLTHPGFWILIFLMLLGHLGDWRMGEE